jgi:hypothetical protein
MLPKDPWFWAVVVVVGAAVVALGIWLVGNISLSISAKGVVFKTKKDGPQRGTPADAGTKTKISVGEGAEIAGEMDRMTGQRVEGAAPLDRATEVGKGAKITGKLGEMTGLDIRRNQQDR